MDKNLRKPSEYFKSNTKDIEAQTKLGLIQMASAGYEGVDVSEATKAGVWVGSAPNGVKGYGHDELKLAAAEADYLVLAIPGTKDNENMIDGTVLGGMKKNAVLVNVGWGILVDESALLAAVKSGHLYGAGLDVVKDEPVSTGNPLQKEPRIFVTPHIAGSTDLMLDGTVSYLGEVLAEFRRGIRSEGIVNEPRNPRVPLRDSIKK